MRAKNCSIGATSAYDAVKLFEAGQAMKRPGCGKGSQSSVKLVRSRHGGHRALGQQWPTSTRIERQDPLIAPIAKGQQIGDFACATGNGDAAQLPVFALEEVPEGGFFRRVWDAIRLWIR